ncbi:hypothetical protein ES332_D11G268900v1 [Gossypium tomentosum]|uniref:Uncharacterized protein n=1 Tax=Gossypium tomentosum TaxID=34277 RepID=A0A5D2ISW2_GOSTO|nr:hypothetical protein ES332_D11G268900v1 [Gossypium tomentosum]
MGKCKGSNMNPYPWFVLIVGDFGTTKKFVRVKWVKELHWRWRKTSRVLGNLGCRGKWRMSNFALGCFLTADREGNPEQERNLLMTWIAGWFVVPDLGFSMRLTERRTRKNLGLSMALIEAEFQGNRMWELKRLQGRKVKWLCQTSLKI